MQGFIKCLQDADEGHARFQTSSDLVPARYVLHPPADPATLEAVERQLGFALPVELKGFYLRWNGGDLLKPTTVLLGPALWFLPLQRLPEEQDRAAQLHGRRALGSIVLPLFTGMEGWAGIDDDGHVLDCPEDKRPSVWRKRIIAQTLDEFLTRLHAEHKIFWFNWWT